MGTITIDTKVNDAAIKALGGTIDDIVSKAKSLSDSLANIGSKVSSSGLKGLTGELDSATTKATGAKQVIDTLGSDVSTRGIQEVSEMLGQIGQETVYVNGQMVNLGNDISMNGLDAILNGLGDISRNVQATNAEISKIGQGVDMSWADAIKSGLADIGNQARSTSSGVGQMFSAGFAAIGGKSLADLTAFNAMARETNKVLINELGDGQKQAAKLWDTVDKATDSSTITMRSAVPSIFGLSKALGLTGKETESVTKNIVDFGSFVELMTGSTQLAESAMFNLSKGVKGSMRTLDQFGVTEDSLKETGLWSGKEEDVKGFTEAVMKATGATQITSDLMKTDAGKLKLMYKDLSREGAKVGMDIMNAIRPVIQGFLDLNKSTGGIPAKIAVIGSVGTVALFALRPLLSTLQSVFSVFGSGLPGFGGKGGGGTVGKGFENLGKTLNSIGSGLISGLPGLLKISAVIAIMMPIAAGLAAEAMVLVRLLGDLFTALRFDKFDFKKSTDSIVQMAKGFGAVAMAFMGLTAINIGTAVHAATGGMVATILSIGVFWTTVKDVIPTMNKISSLNIDIGIGEKLKSLGESLRQINTALGDMANIDWVVVTSFLNPLSNWSASIKSAINDIQKASEELVKIDNLAEIPEGIGGKLQRVTWTLNNVNESVQSLRKIDEGIQTPGNVQTNFVTSLKSARDDIEKASVELKALNLATIPEGVGEKLKTISSSLNSVKNAIESLNKITSYGNGDYEYSGDVKSNGPSPFITALKQAKSDIESASVELKALQLSEIPEGVGGLLQRVSWTLNSVKTALESMNGLNTTIGDIDLSGFIASLKTTRPQLGEASTILKSLSTLGEIDTSVSGKLTALKTTADSVKTAVTSLNAVPAVTNNNTKQAVTVIKNAITELNKIGTKGVQVEGVVQSITKAINGITNALRQTGGATNAAKNLGASINRGLGAGIQPVTNTASNAINNGVRAISSKAGAAYNAGRSVGLQAVAGFKAGLNSGSPGDIARLMQKEIGTYVPQLVWRKSGLVAAMMVRVAKQAITAFKKTNEIGSPGIFAKLYQKEFGKYIPMMIREGIPEIKKAINELSTAGATEALKGLVLGDVININALRIISNRFNDLSSSVTTIVKSTTKARTATQAFAQSYSENTKKAFDAGKKLVEDNKKNYAKIVADTKKAFAESEKARKKYDKAKSGSKAKKQAETAYNKVKFTQKQRDLILGAGKGSKIGQGKNSLGKALAPNLKKLTDAWVNNDEAAIKKLTQAYDKYYSKLGKAGKKQLKDSIANAKKIANEQKAIIKQSIADAKQAITDIKEARRIEINLRNISGTEEEIKRYGDLFAQAQKKADEFSNQPLPVQKKGESDLAFKKRMDTYLSQLQKLLDIEAEQLAYFDEAKRKGLELSMVLDDMGDTAKSTGLDLVALAKSFNQLNNSNVNIDFNLSGMIGLENNTNVNIDTDGLHQVIYDYIKKEMI